uniref:Uncharacterized protein n=1 Tax=Anopheles maculatus TaxID=74869 RepID=A0A182SYN5_9DIPT
MIKNTWDKSINNMPAPPTSTSGSGGGGSTSGGSCSANGAVGSIGPAALLLSGGATLDDNSCLMATTAVCGGGTGGTSVGSGAGALLYLSGTDDVPPMTSCSTLQRAKSQKQLNTDPSLVLQQQQQQQHQNHNTTMLTQTASTLQHTSPNGAPVGGAVLASTAAVSSVGTSSTHLITKELLGIGSRS